jgi:FtsP/CotA-like multicopper oxidase with cupredoxin domain
VDGGFLASPQERNDILLSPGERVDVVIRGTRSPGEYRLWNMPYSRTAGMGMGLTAFSSNRPMELAKLTYEYGDPPPWQVPERLTEIVPLPHPNNVRRFVLGQSMGGMGMGGGRPLAFTINGRTFDMDRVDTQVRLGDTEDWEFLNNTAMDHPIHVHTNPFQIVGTDGEPELQWKDTVLVKAGQRVRIRTRFDDFKGLSVYHCHILDHEDLGMMGTLRVD